MTVLPLLLVLFFRLFPAPAATEAPADAIRATVESARVEGLRVPDFARQRELVSGAYEPGAYAPLWLDDGEPSAHARDAIAVLRDAPAPQGLAALDYDADTLAGQAERLAGGGAALAERARFDVALTVAVVRLISDLHVGRVDPHALGFDYDTATKQAELPALVHDAVTNGDLRDAVARAVPQSVEYELLVRELARYRALAADPAAVPVTLGETVRPGARLRAAPQLARWLAALGELAPGTRVGRAYEGALVEAVQRFQLRHGLGADGIIGETTARALAVPASTRARQIELALERLRWLPPITHDRALFVNVPAFELWAFDEVGSGRAPALQMSVVVGKAVRTETPFFDARMTTIVFAPFWNVPDSIIRKEMVPKLRADPGFLAAQDMEIVSGGSVLAPSAETVALLAHGGAALRQRPGPLNALGRVKFVFPNGHDVYMHDTPSRRLFQRKRRDFSHGCIRLADAAALAHWVLEGEGWEPAHVDEVLGVARQKAVSLRHPIPVIIGYTTAVARLDGNLYFYDDIYGHDAALERALTAPRA